ncbi:hypothetical protein VTN49DRAFT_2262 [Thermomyces lanuginosus]|uniref:uncharacterized protein n=1 Tax=Thermomyces lanuginosus TaxID=5541 RepID=UPI003743124B
MHDIVGSLPPELLLQVVAYLDLEDVVRSQGVSKRWHKTFSSEAIIRPFLRETLTFLGLDSEGISTDGAISDAMRYFRWRHGLEHARPVKKTFIPWPEHLPGMPEVIQCHSHRLCYGNDNQSKVEILNIENGEKSFLSGCERGTVRDLCISNRYVVLGTLTSDLDVTAWDLLTKQKLSQRMPSRPAIYTIVEDKVAIAPICLEQEVQPVYVWDFKIKSYPRDWQLLKSEIVARGRGKEHTGGIRGQSVEIPAGGASDELENHDGAAAREKDFLPATAG